MIAVMKYIAWPLALAACLAGAERKQLFNGKDLTGWEMVGPGRFVVADGAMKTEGGMGLLYIPAHSINRLGESLPQDWKPLDSPTGF
jgi:hypothetical protein